MYRYRYLKTCRVCEVVYFDREITEDQFAAVSDNPHIRVSYDHKADHIEGKATMMSICPGCNLVINSPLA
jgi:ferredoxin-like protein FixX